MATSVGDIVGANPKKRKRGRGHAFLIESQVVFFGGAEALVLTLRVGMTPGPLRSPRSRGRQVPFQCFAKPEPVRSLRQYLGGATIGDDELRTRRKSSCGAVTYRLLTTAVVSLLALAVVAAAQDEKPATPQDTPRAQIDKLKREYDDAMKAYAEKSRNVRSDRELQVLIRTEMPDREAYAKRFLEIAQRHPEDPNVCDALNWVVNNSTRGGDLDPLSVAAVAQLQRDHVTNPRIVGVLGVLSYSGERGRKLLQDVLEKNPDHVCQGTALKELADMKREDADQERMLRGSPTFYALDWLFSPRGKTHGQDPQKLEEEAVAMYERVIREFSDVKYVYADDKTLGDLAKRALFEIRHLSIGGTAPEIAGDDLDGKPMKLSDYRGKVVLLVFWGDWSRVSKSMYRGLKAFVEQFNGKPVVVLGVNSDDDRDRIRARIKELGITWRSWFDGGTEGPIAKEWGIEKWHVWTFYVIDADGAIRFILSGDVWRTPALARVVQKLVKPPE